VVCVGSFFFFFFNDTATTEIYTLSLHDALPIWRALRELMDTPSLPAREEVAFVILAHGPDAEASSLLSESPPEHYAAWLELIPREHLTSVAWRRLPTRFLIWCLRQPHWFPAGREVALALGATRTTAAVPALLYNLDQPFGAREAAAEALGLIGDPVALDRLDEIADKDTVESMRRAARRAAARIRRMEDAGA